MNVEKPIPWYIVYRKIALHLQVFYKKHGADSGAVLYKKCLSSRKYNELNKWLLNVKQSRIHTLEPIQIFVSFNRSRQKENERLEIINQVALLIGMRISWWTINFEGCPTPVALKLQYVRPENEQLRIWQVFDNLVINGKKALTNEIWEEAKAWRGIQIPSFTIFLFWINSKHFLPLDKNTRQYLEARN